jgi:YHS domain-containing protein
MTAIDPVCEMEVDEETAEWKAVYQGKTYYFCSAGCLRSFQNDPTEYVPADESGRPHDPAAPYNPPGH